MKKTRHLTAWQACSDLAHVVLVLVGVRRVTVVIIHIGLEGVLVVIHFFVAILFVNCCIRRYSLYITRMFSDSLSGFPYLSEEPSSSCKPFSSISWGTGRFTFNNKTHLACPQVSPIDHRLVWVLVGLVGRTLRVEHSPRDCRTTFTNWLLFNCRTQFIIPSSPIGIVSQRDIWWWSRRKYDFSNKTSPVFNLTTFGIQ